jgi:hypothetical protein
MVGEVDHLWGLGFGLGRCELRERSVWPRGSEMVKIDVEGLSQVAFVDDQYPLEQFAAQCSDHPFADRIRRGAGGGLVRIRMPSAAKAASNALVNRESRSRSRNVIVVAHSPRSLSRVRAA